MRLYAVILLFSLYSFECRKILPPINKNANIDFINMEAGGARAPNNVRPTPAPVPGPVPAKPASSTPATPFAPVPVNSGPAKPAPAPQSTNPSPTTKPVIQPAVKQGPTQAPALITPKPVNPTPAARPITTPGPGSVKQLITFYDSQGKASPIRPYTYSQAVKQG